MLRRYDYLTKKTLTLLQAGESDQVDYKESLAGLKSEALVAFANSNGGGTILIGIKEGLDEDGKQIGIPIGHDSSDGTLLAITNKAAECIPPIPLDVFVEKHKTFSILRIVIPDSLARPHCTKSGVYKIRANARNTSLQPTELLSIFMEKEVNIFNTRFKEATTNIEESISKLEDIMQDSLNEMMADIGMAELNVEEATNTIDEVKNIVSLNLSEILTQKFYAEEEAARTQSLLKAVEASDPSEQRFTSEIQKYFEKKMSEAPLIKEHILSVEKLEMKIDNNWDKILGESTVEDIIREVIVTLRKKHLNAS